MSSRENTPKRVTIGIICKNEEEHIGETLSYLIEQDYPHDSIEIIIVDGNSTDNTRTISENILQKNDIPYKIINERECKNKDDGANYGHSFARNCVIDNMDTESIYLAWIDADCRADIHWLSALVGTMEENTDPHVIGAGGRRIVEHTENIPKKELMLNYYFTSRIMSLRNPAFSESNVTHMPSIAGYNSIYRADIFRTYRYDTTYPFNTDDIEMNYRLSRDGYRFLHAKNAYIYHRMDPSIGTFLKQMKNYGRGALQTSLIHRQIVRPYILISLIYMIGVIMTPIAIFSGVHWLEIGAWIGWGSIGILSIAVCIENIHQAKTWWSLIVIGLIPLHVWMYGVGVIETGLYAIRGYQKSKIHS